MELILRSERVLLGDGARGFRLVPAEVRVQGRHIVAVEERGASGWSPPPPGAQVLDAPDTLITPAFVNTHTHLAMSAFRGLATPRVMTGNVVEELYFAVESHLQPGDVRAFTRLGAWESLLSGVGCVWDHYYYAREIVDALRDVGLEGVIAPTLQDLAGPGVGQLGSQWDETLRIHEDTALREAGIVAALGPHATDTVSPELWRRIARTSAEQGLPIHVHVAQSIEEARRAQERLGCTPVEGLERHGVLEAADALLLVHCLFVGRPDIARLDPARHLLVHCPWSQVQFGFPAAERAWGEAGIPLALGTDCGSCNDTMDVQQELRMMAWGPSYATSWSEQAERFLRSGAMEDAEALHDRRGQQIGDQLRSGTTERLLDAVWRVPGAIHQHARQGTLDVGQRANLAIWDTRHPSLWPGNDFLHAFVMSSTQAALRGLVVGGEVRIDPAVGPGPLLRDPRYAAHRLEASERLSHLLERAGVDAQPWRRRG